jgi:hypothetical protein
LSPLGKVLVKNEGRQDLPGGLHRLLSRNEKTTGALIEPARGLLILSTVDHQQTSPRPGKPKKLPNQK